MGSDSEIPEGFQLEGSGIPEGFVEEGSPGAPIPNHENLLQRAIQSSRMGQNSGLWGASNAAGMLPQTGEEALDVGKIGVGGFLGGVTAPSLTPMSWGASLMDKKPPIIQSPLASIPGVQQAQQALAPETQYGKDLSTAASIASPIAMFGTGMGSPEEAATVSLNKGPGLFDITGRRAAQYDAVQNASDTISDAQYAKNMSANKTMDESLVNMEDSGVNQNHLNDIVMGIAEKLDGSGTTWDNPKYPAGQVMNLAQNLDPDEIPANFSGKQLQAEIGILKNKLGEIGPKSPLGSTKAQGLYSEVAQNILPKEYLDIAGERGAGYQANNAANPLLKNGILNRISKGLVSPQKMGEYQDAQKGLGVDVLQDLMKAGKAVKSSQTARGLGQGAMRATGVGGLLDLIKHFF